MNGLERYIIGEFYGGMQLNIDKKYYEQIMNARNIFIILWDIEASFSLLVNSLIEFEEEFFKIALEEVYKREHEDSYDIFLKERLPIINLKTMSLLSAASSHRDHTLKKVSELSKITKSIQVDYKSILKQVYDNSLEYRVMDALRNHTVHNNLPIQRVTIDSTNVFLQSKIKRNEISILRTTFNPKISFKHFIQNKKNPSKIRDEVGKIGVDLDLKFFARVYVEKIADCHYQLRKETDEVAFKMFEIIKNIRNKIHQNHEQFLKNIYIWKTKNSSDQEKFFIGLDLFKRILSGRKQWANLANIHKIYISSEIIQEKKSFP